MVGDNGFRNPSPSRIAVLVHLILLLFSLTFRDKFESRLYVVNWAICVRSI